MSVLKKEQSTSASSAAASASPTSGGLRVESDDPHLVSFGGDRLSTGIRIHHIPFGTLTIGSHNCDVNLNGSGVQPLHCTVKRSLNGEVTIYPELDARTLIDCSKINEETKLTQGGMLTIGKSNYLRYNNPAEAQFIKSTMGSNERISMSQIDFSQQDSPNSSNDGSTPDDVFKNLTSILESQNYTYNSNNNNNINNSKLNNNILEKITKMDYSNIKNFHSPKVFTADSITINTPAKDVLGTKYNNFTKNLTQNSVNYAQNITSNDKVLSTKINNNISSSTSSTSTQLNSSTASMNDQLNDNMLTKVNNTLNGRVLELPSPLYDRYPKPGAYGSMKIYPINGVDNSLAEAQRDRAQHERLLDEETKKLEQIRLEEILSMCQEYDRQNQPSNYHSSGSITNSPIVQNRIKTNGSLPREKKSPFPDLNNDKNHNNSSNIFFPDNFNNNINSPVASYNNHKNNNDNLNAYKSSNGYENVRLNENGRAEIITSSRYENVPMPLNGHSNTESRNGYENVFKSSKKYVPQSPRTRIRTCVSPPSQSKSKEEQQNEYDLLIQSFEDKLRMEIQSLRDNKFLDPKGFNTTQKTSDASNHNSSLNNVSLNGTKDDVEDLQKSRSEIIENIRKLKTSIAELQRQEDEVLRELDMEKALVTAELTTECSCIMQSEEQLVALQSKLHRSEAQRSANRVMQETQQAKLKHAINVKQDQICGLEKLIYSSGDDTSSFQEELNKTMESLENDKKLFEDLEFQYLEEEADWLASREEFTTQLKELIEEIEEKKEQMTNLENQKLDNQKTACNDTKALEQDILTFLQNLEICREQLKDIDERLFNILGQDANQCQQSDSDDDIEMVTSRGNNNKIMSQSLFGSAEILSQARIGNKPNLMSMSVHEYMFNNNIEALSSFDNILTSTPVKEIRQKDAAKSTEDISSQSIVPKKLDELENISYIDDDDVPEEEVDPSTKQRNSNPAPKLKYNLQGLFDEDKQQKSKSQTSINDYNPSFPPSMKINLNLLLDDAEFEVNPLIKRLPSQDDIDRICKVTSNAPISTQGASYKVKESIKEIERNRQLLLAQQGSHVIEHERQRVSELKKRSQDEARAHYMQLHNGKHLPEREAHIEGQEHQLKPLSRNQTSTLPKHDRKEKTSLLASPQRHSHPEFDTNHSHQQQQQQQPQLQSSAINSASANAGGQNQRPLSEANSDMSNNGGGNHILDKGYKSNSDVRVSPMRLQEINEDGSTAAKQDEKNSIVSDSGQPGQQQSADGRLVSGARRNYLPKPISRPLTRYLPVLGPDLDLREHVEEAGHQITLCPHIILDSTSCRGYLHKLGATFRAWSRRWFVFDREQSALIYYSDKTEKKPRGGAYFETIDEVYLDHLNVSKSGRPHCTFIVKTKKRSYHLQAASDAAARIWIDAIITGAQGNVVMYHIPLGESF